jgi:Carbohydrate family 9 binding domain-like/Domain of unknown function (DUF5916)
MTAPPPCNWLARLVLAGLLALPSSIAAQRSFSPEDTVRIPRIEAPIVVDGRLDDAAWAAASVLDGFVQTQPGDNIPPSVPTSVRLAWDDDALYFGFVAKDTPRHIRATVTRRDDVLQDDYVQVFLDTFGDHRRAYDMIFNPLGVQQDGIFTEGSEPDFSVDVVMTSRGTISDSGYTVEVAIPFRSLRYSIREDRPWGLHIVRVRKDSREEHSWRPLVRGQSSYLGQAGQVIGIAPANGTRALDVIPSLMAVQTGTRQPAGFVEADPEFRPGLTARAALSSGLAVDLALNPDFAQVEADAPVVTANQRFPIFFEEKRPFFLEGVDLLQTPLRVVHTRTVLDPDAAVKLAGKNGRASLGVLLASDNGPGSFSDLELSDSSALASAKPFLDRNATLGIARFRRDMGARSNLGFLATAYDFVERRSLAIGADGRLALGLQNTIAFQVLGSAARRRFYDPDRDLNRLRDGYGLGYYVRGNRTGRHWNHTVTAEGRSPDYVADLGFTLQTNTHMLRWETRYDAEPRPRATLVSWSAYFRAFGQMDWQEYVTYAYLFPGVAFKLPAQTSVDLSAYTDYLRLEEGEFGARRGPARIGAFSGEATRSTNFRGVVLTVGTAPSERYSVTLTADRSWDVFDYDFGAPPKYPRVSPAALSDPAAPLDPGTGNQLTLTGELTWRPSDTWRTTLNYTRDRLVRTDTRRVAFDENLVSLRVTHQFTQFLALRARVDYSDLQSNVRGELLGSWTPSPGSALYVGYTDDLEWNGYSTVTGRRQPGWNRKSRTTFVKVSYLWRNQL